MAGPEGPHRVVPLVLAQVAVQGDRSEPAPLQVAGEPVGPVLRPAEDYGARGLLPLEEVREEGELLALVYDCVELVERLDRGLV